MFSTVTSGFDLKLRMSFAIGLLISAPFWMWQIWAFIMPGLTRKEIRYTIPKEGTGLFMDCLVIPKDAPHLDLTYKMMNHILSPAPQKVFATEQSAGITNLDTVPMLSKELQEAYGYADLRSKLQKARLQPMPPTEPGTQWATYDDFLKEYQRLQKA